ncbi:hypothetical protein SPHV1_2280114 [Novosphingobium sp. KN65.2]|nr:hypothetical protein SPHV1_2280114 [Novosphingobium sp. KN65.2]
MLAPVLRIILPGIITPVLTGRSAGAKSLTAHLSSNVPLFRDASFLAGAGYVADALSAPVTAQIRRSGRYLLQRRCRHCTQRNRGHRRA